MGGGGGGGAGMWQETHFPWDVIFCVNVCLVNDIPDVICWEWVNNICSAATFCDWESWEANDYLSSCLYAGGHTCHVWANRCGPAILNHFKGAVKILTLLKVTYMDGTTQWKVPHSVVFCDKWISINGFYDKNAFFFVVASVFKGIIFFNIPSWTVVCVSFILKVIEISRPLYNLCVHSCIENKPDLKKETSAMIHLCYCCSNEVQILHLEKGMMFFWLSVRLFQLP